jgi:hypothetical protein
MMSIDPDEVFAAVEADRASGELSKKVTTATIVYQGSDRPGTIEQINRETGQRVFGTFADGVFTPLDDDS